MAKWRENVNENFLLSDTSSHDLLRGKSFSMSASMNEKLNAEIQATFAAKEAETVDGGLNSKVYKINDDKITVKNETIVRTFFNHWQDRLECDFSWIIVSYFVSIFGTKLLKSWAGRRVGRTRNLYLLKWIMIIVV